MLARYLRGSSEVTDPCLLERDTVTVCPVCVPCVRNHTQTHIHTHTINSHTKAGPARGRLCVPAPPGDFLPVPGTGTCNTHEYCTSRVGVPESV